MKIEVNFDEKIIKLMDKVQIDTLVKTLKKMFPDDYKEYTLDAGNTIVTWVNYPNWTWSNGYYYSQSTGTGGANTLVCTTGICDTGDNVAAFTATGTKIIDIKD